MSDKQDLIGQFSNVTGANTDRAAFYLESSGWNIEMALTSFFDGGDEDEEDVVAMATGPAAVASPVSEESQPKSGKKDKSQSSRVATFRSMKSNEDSDEEGQAFYAGGGGEHGSGQQVLGPPKKKESANKIVDTIFKSAKEHGAEEVSSHDPIKQRSAAFKGAGYRLGETDDSSEVIAGPFPRPSEPEKQVSIEVALKLWKAGFSVDDGPLRKYDDPQNKEFLDSVHKGQIPLELIRLAKGGEVGLQMEDHRDEDFVPPKKAMKAFTGGGYMLGSPAPKLTTQQAPSSKTEQNENIAVENISVDTSQPTTNIQIRLADGTRLVAKFNHSHTVQDIRTYITTARLQFSGANFILMTTFPNKELSDESLTIEDAKLLNAVIVQRLK